MKQMLQKKGFIQVEALSRKQRYMKKYLNDDSLFEIWNKGISETKSLQSPVDLSESFQDLAKIDLKSFQESPKIETFTTSPILAIFTVSFHHKRGSEIEYQYPAQDQIRNLFTQESDFEDFIQKIPVYALPDAVHNCDEDYLYFTMWSTIKNKKKILFGVTYFKQIKVTQEMKDNDKEITRSHLQKSICMISCEPLFGYIKNRLEPTIRAYFQLQNFSDMSLIQFAYQNIEQVLEYEKCNTYILVNLLLGIQNITLNDIYIDSYLQTIFSIFKEKIFKIIKAIMLKMRQIVFLHYFLELQCSHSVQVQFLFFLQVYLVYSHLNQVSHFKITKMPHSQLPISIIFTNQFRYYQQFGFPLDLFNESYPFFMYFTVNDLPQIDSNIQGYLMGTTNKFIKTLGKLNPEMIVDIDSEQIILLNEDIKSVLETKDREKGIIAQIMSKYNKPQIDRFKNFKKAEEGDQWIRQLVHFYLQQLMSEMYYLKKSIKELDVQCSYFAKLRTRKRILKQQTIITGSQDVQQISDGSDEGVNEEQLREEISKMTKEEQEQIDYLALKPKDFLIKELQIKELRSRISSILKTLSNYNKKFVFEIFNKFDTVQSDTISIFSESYEQRRVNMFLFQEDGTIRIGKFLKGGFQCDTGIYICKEYSYVGQFKNGKKHGQGKQSNGYHYQGYFWNDLKHGEGRLLFDGGEYKGHFETDKFNGFGNLTTNENELYEGEFKEGIYHGSGKLIKQNHEIYVGQFQNGIQNGEGQYIWQDGAIYKGGWKNGERNGMGIYQNEDYEYEGEWVKDKRQGYGSIKMRSIKYQGQFEDDELINSQVIIKYEDDSVYQGEIKDWQPNGQGLLAMSNGDIKQGQFKDGTFLE